MLLSLLNLFTSLLLRLFGLFEAGRGRDVSDFARCTPVVCTGGPKLDKLPNKSVKPPNAERLVSALRAPGFASNCASGMADANEAAALCVASVALFEFDVGETAVGVVAVGGDPLAAAAAPACSCAKLAFCNSTLLGKIREKRIEKKTIFVVRKGFVDKVVC